MQTSERALNDPRDSRQIPFLLQYKLEYLVYPDQFLPNFLTLLSGDLPIHFQTDQLRQIFKGGIECALDVEIVVHISLKIGDKPINQCFD